MHTMNNNRTYGNSVWHTPPRHSVQPTVLNFLSGEVVGQLYTNQLHKPQCT